MKILDKVFHNTDKYRDRDLGRFVRSFGLTVRHSIRKGAKTYVASVILPKTPVLCAGKPLTIENHVEYLTKALLKTIIVAGHEEEDTYDYLKDCVLLLEDGPTVWQLTDPERGPVLHGSISGRLEKLLPTEEINI